MNGLVVNNSTKSIIGIDNNKKSILNKFLYTDIKLINELDKSIILSWLPNGLSGLFVILIDTEKPEESWKLKRNFDLVFSKIDNFFNREKVSSADEVVFSFNKKTHTAVSKVLLISQ